MNRKWKLLAVMSMALIAGSLAGACDVVGDESQDTEVRHLQLDEPASDPEAKQIYAGQCGGKTYACDSDVQTGLFRYDWTRHLSEFEACRDRAEVSFQACLQPLGDWNEENAEAFEACYSSYQAQRIDCAEGLAISANLLPLRECGAEVITFSRSGPIPGVQGELASATLSKDDVDGDGIPNGEEFWMGLNPCDTTSDGNQLDSALDYDADGEPNDQDKDPLCPAEAGIIPGDFYDCHPWLL